MVYHMDTSDVSSLISEIYYDEEKLELTVKFKKYYVPYLIHCGVKKHYFEQFSEVKSIGSYYLTIIKTKFKIMAEEKLTRKDLGVNNSSDQKRFIKQRLCVSDMLKEWFYIGEKGDIYCDVTLQLLPNGETDRYGGLGMITQDVPTDIAKAEAKENIPKADRSKGPILGNGFEFRRKDTTPENAPGSNAGTMMGENNNAVDDLPF